MKAFCLGAALAAAATAAIAQDAGGDFDFYVLSLSWSPTYCATDDTPDADQCRGERGFVVHGLWPQYERGYPEFCRSDQPRWLAQDVIDDNRDVFSSGGLAIHQWRKHGMCSGLTQRAYFDLTRAAAERIAVPRALTAGSRKLRAAPQTVEELFRAVNQGLEFDGLSVQCRDGLMSEVRVCLTRGLDFRTCRDVDADGCRRASLTIPAAR
ncbi:MAG: ribonuclease T2 family protein [Alphaproteobacteria bacterium]